MSGPLMDQDIEAVRRSSMERFPNDRYFALMDLSHFLATDHIDALAAADAVLNRPMTSGPLNNTFLDYPTSSRSFDVPHLDPLNAPPAPPLPRMMKSLLKDRRRFQRQFITGSGAGGHLSSNILAQQEADKSLVEAQAIKAMENYQLKSIFDEEMKNVTSEVDKEFASDLLYSSILGESEDVDYLFKEL